MDSLLIRLAIITTHKLRTIGGDDKGEGYRLYEHFLSSVAKKKWEDVKAQEITCRMEASVSGGLPSITPQELVGQMDEAGVEKTFLCGCYIFSYWQKSMIMEPNHDDIIEAVNQYPIGWWA